jgi:Fur family ferric uptake transcriptional regulator
MPESDWEVALRAQGHRVTTQRLAILRAVAEERHPTAESIYEALRDSEPPLNLSTVYRNLALLQQAGLITHAHIDAGSPVYHLAEEPSHIHLSCLACGAVKSVEPDTASAFAQRVAADTGFVIEPGHSAVYGRCADCAGPA